MDGPDFITPGVLGFVGGIVGMGSGMGVGLAAPPAKALAEAAWHAAQTTAVITAGSTLVGAALGPRERSAWAGARDGCKLGLLTSARLTAIEAAGTLAARATLAAGAHLLPGGNGLGMLAAAVLAAGAGGAAANLGWELASPRPHF